MTYQQTILEAKAVGYMEGHSKKKKITIQYMDAGFTVFLFLRYLWVDFKSYFTYQEIT